MEYKKRIKLVRVYWNKGAEGDKWFYAGKSFQGRYQTTDGNSYVTLYGYAVYIGRLHICLCSVD